ncbi:MAG: ribbon-helix-helix protein, CopG family [Ardenticatenaceae bacterium]|nr:ribbon-helix-helix protein, CopG family [Anaerolineales bacterium]MCB8923365.1 ribbon-helix-helix protein, CopG family [Ardenticatenaceae bacterium]
MKTIQMTIDEALLTQVDHAVQEDGTNRSAFMRQALEEALRHRRIARLEEQDKAGYLAHPVEPGEFDVWFEEQVWEEEEVWSAVK